MVDADQERASAPVIIDVMYLPEGATKIQRGAVQITGQCLEFILSGFAREGYSVQVVVNIEERVVLPVYLVTFINNVLAEPLKTQETLIEDELEAACCDRFIENQYRRDHHRVTGRVHPQP